ncbi:hypothetical protein BDW60DRAFT_207142 [Aspergillus nidulans var. acristatus]
MATPPTPITFYDIAMRTPSLSCSPNPSKTRLALNFASVPYKTTFVPLPSIPSVRQSLGVPAGRKFADGSDFYTLPVIVDEATGSKIGDSFDIAIYLHERYADANGAKGDLFPVLRNEEKLDFRTPNTAMLVPLSAMSEAARQDKYLEYATFNTHVDAAFTLHVLLTVHGLPFPPDTAEATRAEFCKRAGVPSWDAFTVSGEARGKLKESLKETLAELAKLFVRNENGPFILGEKPCYADFIVGGWLRMLSVCLPADEWEEVRGWHGGVFGRVFDALSVYMEVKE